MRRPRRALKVFAWVALALAVLALGVAVGAYLYLRSDAGERRLRSLVTTQANAQLSGRLEIGDLEAAPAGGEIELRDVRLYDPDGELVARIGLLRVKAALKDLLAKKVHLRDARAQDAELLLVQGPEGLNLARAVEPRSPSPETQAQGPFAWDIQLDGLTLQELRVSYAAGPDEPPAFDVGELALTARGRYRQGESRLVASAVGRIAAPVAGPFALDLLAEGGSPASPHEPLSIKNLEIKASGSRARLSGTLAGDRLDATLAEVFVPRRDIDALVPGSPLLQDFSASGKATLEGSNATAKLTAPAGGGSLRLEAKGDLKELSGSADLDFEGVDLSQVIAQAPATHLAGRASGRFQAGEPGPGEGRLRVTLGRSTVSGAEISSATATLSSAGSVATIESLEAVVPGGRLAGSGTLSADRLDARAVVRSGDVARLGAELARLAGAEAPPIRGRGEVELTLAGPWESLRIEAEGRLPSFGAATLAAGGVTLRATVPDVSRPFLFSADVSASDGSLGELAFRNLRVKARANRRTFDAEVSSTGAAALSATLRGELDEDQQGGTLAALTASAAGVRWELSAPARLSWRDGARVDRLALASGEQKLLVEGGLSGRKLDAFVRAQKLDLGRVPKAVLPDGVVLSGVLDAQAKLGGTTAKPKGVVTLTGTGLGYGRYDRIDASGSVSVDSARAIGRLSLSRAGSSAKASFDVPLELLESKAGTPLSARIELSGTDLKELARLLDLEGVAGGAAEATVEVSGTSDAPNLALTGRVTDLVYGDFPQATVSLTADSAQESKATAEVSVRGGAAVIDVRAPLALRKLVLDPPAPESLLDVPVQVSARAPTLALETLAGSVLPDGLSGKASLEAALNGTARRPRGTVKIGIAGAALGKLENVRAGLEVFAEDGDVRIVAEASQANEKLGTLDARLAAPAERLWPLAELEKAMLEGKLVVASLPLAQVLPAETQTAGDLRAEVAIRGTLAAPLLTLQAKAEDLAYQGAALGEAELSATYGGGRAVGAAALSPASGGNARVDGTLRLDLGLAALLEGLDLDAAQLSARLRAQAMELAIVNAFQLAPLRQVAGLLDAELDLRGALTAPTLRGTAALKSASVTIEGYGSYREISGRLSLSERTVEISDLVARAGAGSARLNARAERPGPEQPYQVAARLNAQRMPITVEDQVVAFLTGETDAIGGQVQGLKANLEVRAGRLHVELPEIGGGKDLQSLEPHPDVFVVSGERARGVDVVAASAERGSSLELRLRLQAPKGILVESSDVRIEAVADLKVESAEGRTQLSGEIETRQGRAEVLGRKFELVRGKVTYLNDPPGNPRLDMLATHENQREQVKVKVTVGGTAQRPKIELASEPPLDEAQIATLLATGRRELKRGSGGVAAGGTGAASAVGALLADRLRKTISTKLPLDVLQVELGEQGVTEGGLDARLEAGTYVTDEIYVGYRRNFGARTENGENTNEVRVEYQITPRLSIESQYGDGLSGGADVVYSRDY